MAKIAKTKDVFKKATESERQAADLSKARGLWKTLYRYDIYKKKGHGFTVVPNTFIRGFS